MGFRALPPKAICSSAAFIRFDSTTTEVQRGKSFSISAASSVAREPYKSVAMKAVLRGGRLLLGGSSARCGMLFGPVPLPFAVAT